MTFEQALKVARRNTFVYGKDWRVAVIAPASSVLAVAWDEAKALIEASSLGLERANYATRTMELERGAIIRFHTVADSLDMYKLAGHQYTQMLFMASKVPYPAQTTEYLRALLRSPVVPTDNLVWSEYVTL